jgi:hypothetical protein
MQSLKKAKLKLHAYNNVISDLENGESLTVSCRKYNVNIKSFRNFITSGFGIGDEEYTVKSRYAEFLTWEDRLAHDIFGRTITVCVDFDEVYEWALQRINISQRNKEIFELILKDEKFVSSVAQMYNLSNSRVGEIYKIIMHKLRHPEISQAFYYGMSYVNDYINKENEIIRNRAAELNNKISNMLKKYDSASPNCNCLSTPIDTPLEELHLRVRTYSSLKRQGLNTIQDILDYHDSSNLMKVRNFGRASFDDLQKEFKRLGIAIVYK